MRALYSPSPPGEHSEVVGVAASAVDVAVRAAVAARLVQVGPARAALEARGVELAHRRRHLLSLEHFARASRAPETHC